MHSGLRRPFLPPTHQWRAPAPPLPPEGLGPLRILLGVLLLLSLPCSPTFSPNSPLPPPPCPRPPPPFPGRQLATARSSRPSRRHREPPLPDWQPATARSGCSSRRHQKLGRSRWRPACADPATTESHPPCLRKRKKRGGEEVGGGRQGRLKHEYHTPSRRAPDPWRPPALHRRWVVGRPRFTRRATSAHTGVEAGFRHPREGDRRVFGSCGPPSARPRAARESSPSPRAPGAGWSGSIPPAVPVLRPTAGFQTGRARAQCAPGAHAIRLGTARPARHGAVPGRGATWYAGPEVTAYPLRPGPVPVFL